jgi:antitoxin ParD1/3/4
MTKIERISVELTSELIAVVNEAVETGDYVSESDVVRDALRAWKLSRTMRDLDVSEIKRLWQEGLDSGPATDAQPVFDRLKMKYDRATGSE